MNDKGYIIRRLFTGEFYCGLGKWDKQLRKAQIYHSRKEVEKYAEHCKCVSLLTS